MFVVKDFIATADGLFFAVVENGVEQGRVLCFLRYVRENNAWKKCSTVQANQLLKTKFPEYLYYSETKDAHLHGIKVGSISRHLQPKKALQHLSKCKDTDSVQQDFINLLQLFQQQGLNIKHLGITGSLLLNAQNHHSDIDLVLYNKDEFQYARKIIQSLIEQKNLQPLTDDDWQASYARRSCALDLKAYIRHEQRKFNKAIINGRKFDISLVNTLQLPGEKFKKKGRIKLQARVIDDVRAFDYPAQFDIDHQEIGSVVSFTATYTGQAEVGEVIEIAGQLEISAQGYQRVVVGSSREAAGEYIKVIEKIT